MEEDWNHWAGTKLIFLLATKLYRHPKRKHFVFLEKIHIRRFLKYNFQVNGFTDGVLKGFNAILKKIYRSLFSSRIVS